MAVIVGEEDILSKLTKDWKETADILNELGWSKGVENRRRLLNELQNLERQGKAEKKEFGLGHRWRLK